MKKMLYCEQKELLRSVSQESNMRSNFHLILAHAKLLSYERDSSLHKEHEVGTCTRVVCQNDSAVYSLKRKHFIRFLLRNEKYSLRLSADMIKYQ